VALNTEEKAEARRLIHDTYNRQIADENAKLMETSEKANESAFDLIATFQGFGQVASSAFEDAIIKGEELSTVMSGLAEDIQRLLLRGTMNKLFEVGIDAASGALGRWMGGGSSLSLQGGTGAGGYTTGGFQTTPSFMPQAAGNAFYAGNVIPFARGGVVSRPTIFPMARGMAPGHFVPGVMGEAGPEAVMPLTRLPSGKLGVEASGKGVTVNVINNTPAQVKTEERRDERGGVTMNVVIDMVEQAMAQRATRPGTTLNRALATAASPVKAR
jgi:phage-related minor tail protein